jgi:hypothetical protein
MKLNTINRTQFLFYIIAAAATTTSLAHAGTDYRCTIERIYDADNEKSQIAFQRNQYIGKQFTVDRRSGVMIGALRNSFMTKPVVVDSGSKDDSFKVVTTMRRDQGIGAGSNIYALVVNEHVDSPKKPFSFLMNDTVYFGGCVHF